MSANQGLKSSWPSILRYGNKYWGDFFDKIEILINDEGYPVDDNFTIKYPTTTISDIKMSFNEKYLAVALAAIPEENAKIEM